mmetsp:Transcript_3370/g.12026  ORF Transcript_3370/g.12026 Transcript_3370/m.12026 type:complete len:400 (-) Transcript_3370:296-1495(-)
MSSQTSRRRRPRRAMSFSNRRSAGATPARFIVCSAFFPCAARSASASARAAAAAPPGESAALARAGGGSKSAESAWRRRGADASAMAMPRPSEKADPGSSAKPRCLTKSKNRTPCFRARWSSSATRIRAAASASAPSLDSTQPSSAPRSESSSAEATDALSRAEADARPPSRAAWRSTAQVRRSVRHFKATSWNAQRLATKEDPSGRVVVKMASTRSWTSAALTAPNADCSVRSAPSLVAESRIEAELCDCRNASSSSRYHDSALSSSLGGACSAASSVGGDVKPGADRCRASGLAGSSSRSSPRRVATRNDSTRAAVFTSPDPAGSRYETRSRTMRGGTAADFGGDAAPGNASGAAGAAPSRCSEHSQSCSNPTETVPLAETARRGSASRSVHELAAK